MNHRNRGEGESQHVRPAKSSLVRLVRRIARGFDRCSGDRGRRRRRLHQGELHEVRVPHPDARRRPAVHRGVRPQGYVPPLPDPAEPHAVQRGALRGGFVSRRYRAVVSVQSRRLHRRLSGRSRAVDVGGRVRQHAAFPSAQGRRRRDRREHRHVRYDRLARQEHPQQQRQGRSVGDFVSGLLHVDGDDRRPSRAQGRVAPGADRRLVRGRRLAPQRGVLPAPRLQFPGEERPSPPPADQVRPEGRTGPSEDGRVRVLPRNGTALERQRPLLQGRRPVLERDAQAPQLRRLLGGAEHPAAPQEHQAGRADRRRLVRRREPLRRP